MNGNRFIIRESHFGCGDEDYFRTGKTLQGVYDDKEKAKKALEVLTKRHKKEFFDMPEIARMKAFDIIELDETATIYVLWNPEEDAPFINDEVRMYGDFLMYGESRERATRMAFEFEIMEKKLTGSLDELSNSPELLEALIESEDGLSYKPKTSELKITLTKAVKAVPALNALLKKPFYEIREMPPVQVRNLENKLVQTKEL